MPANPRTIPPVRLLMFGCLLAMLASLPASAQTWLQPLPCSAESGLKSLNGNTPTTIQFVNDTSIVLQIYWLDYSGHRVLYDGALLPGASFTQATFLTHPWVVTDTEGTCVGGIFLSVAPPGGFAIIKDASSTTNSFVYVTNQGFDTVTNQQVPSVVSVYDQASNIQVATVTGFQNALGIAVAPGSGTVYVSDFANNDVAFIDPITNTVTTMVPVGLGPFGINTSPDGKFLWVANDGISNTGVISNTVSVIDTSLKAVVATIPVGPADYNPFWVVVTPDGNHAYVSAFNNETGGSLIEINTTTYAIEATIQGDDNAGGLAVTPDGRFLFATSFQFVPRCGSCAVAVIDTSTNEVVANIRVPRNPRRVTIAPDGTTAYVASSAGFVTPIDVATLTAGEPIPVGNTPRGMGITPDGAFLYVPNLLGNTISEISTAEATVVATFESDFSPSNVGLATTSQSITITLSPTALNTFNFGPHSYKVQYPPGTSFSGVTMTVTATEIPQAVFHDTRLLGTPFANANCIVYGGTGGNCIVYAVSCTPSPCPTSPDGLPDITILTSYDTTQQIVNPGFLEAPDSTNNWQNVFTDFFLQRIDPTTKGGSSGFSDWVAVDLGVDPSTQAGTMGGFLPPLGPKNSRVFTSGTTIPVKFQVKNAAGQFIGNVKARLSVQLGSTPVPVQAANFKGSGASFVYNTVLNQYQFYLSTVGFKPGTYNLTVFSNSFPATFTTFTIQ